MDMLHEILIGLFSGTSIFGVFEAIRYRRENKRLKAAEAGTAEADTSKAQTEAQVSRMELADLYLNKVMDLTEKSYQATLKNNEDILSTTKQLGEKIDSVQRVVKDIVEYLDGDFDKHLKEKYGKA